MRWDFFYGILLPSSSTRHFNPEEENDRPRFKRKSTLDERLEELSSTGSDAPSSVLPLSLKWKVAAWDTTRSMADDSATGRSPSIGERRATTADARTVSDTTAVPVVARSARLREVVLSDDQEEEDEEESDDYEEIQPQRGSVGMRLGITSSATMATTTTAAGVTAASREAGVRAPLPSLVNRSSATISVETGINSPRFPPASVSGLQPQPQPRNQRNSSAGDAAANASSSGMEWGVDGDEGWMPKPARLHSGKSRSCAVCFAPLQYTAMQSWDEYVQSAEYLRRLQENLLCDTFISSLICGESTSGGDLPTEHRMHKNRKLKCRQSVHDYVNMTSAGVIDQAYKENSSVRILEEMLLHGLSTPLFTSMLERRLAVISHSTGIAQKLMHESPVLRLPREVATPSPNVELHYLAIQTLSALLQSFDFSVESGSSHGRSRSPLQVFEEMTRILACFPALSLYSFWSPAQRFPEKPLSLLRSMVEASSTATTPRLLAAEFAIDGSETSYWQSQPRPGVTFFSIRHAELSSVSSISVRWHLKCFSKIMKVQYRVSGSDTFVQLVEQAASSTNGPEYFETRFPRRCEEVRLIMSGMPTANRSACYAIEAIKLNVRITNTRFVDPKSTLQDVSGWLLKATEQRNEDVVVEAISALRGWTLATASLGSVLTFVQMLLKVKQLWPRVGSKLPGVASFALDQARLLLKGLHAYRLEETERIIKNVGKKSTSESRKIRALFEPSCCSSGVTVEDGGVAVRTRETSYQYAAVNVGVSSGRASWKFRLDNDTVDDEMTCFGAAILPVTVSGYDSSPNLWMLRGYNGNLYARGHKLSRSIGKVHPGDTIQIDVDMTEGTLGYKINDTDYGAVFTDLAGHEVYPAVSFYGSGKVITLLGVEKWDDVEIGKSIFDPVFLSNLKEYHYSVGYGTFGKGTQLGYAGDSAVRPVGTTAAPQTSVIRVSGELKQRSLSTHPPARGEASVLYDLRQSYCKLLGLVAINDDVHNDILEQRGVSVIFSIIGDGVILWQSKPLAQARTSTSFELDVSGVRMLELRASCPGSNQCAHAIWVDPHLILLDEWQCSECDVANKGSTRTCSVCASERRQVEDPVGANASSPSIVSASTSATTGSGESMKDLPEEAPFDECVNSIIARVVDLTQIEQSVAGKAAGFEQPFCRQPCEQVFRQLLAMLSAARQVGVVDSCSRTKHQRTLSVLDLFRANLCNLVSYDVCASDLGIQEETLEMIKSTLENLAFIFGREVQAELPSDEITSREVEIAAANALIAGLAALYTPPQKVKLLLVLLRGHRDEAHPSQSAKRLLLSSILRALALPGRDGVLSFLPSVSAMQQEDENIIDGVEQVPLGDIEEVVSLLIAMACAGGSNEKEQQKVESADSGDADIADTAMRLLQSYQIMLLAEVIEVTSKKPDNVTVGGQQLVRASIQEATVNYSSLLLRYGGNVMSALIEEQAEQSLSMNESSNVTPGLQSSVRASELPILSRLLPWLVSCLCLLRRQSWLAIPILPSVVKFSGIVDQYCSELLAVKASESRIRRLERFIKARSVESQELERMLATDKALAMHHQASKPMYNVFKQLYTGDKDHFEGQIGFQFEATSTFSIIALGRSVNLQKNSGQLVRQHAIRLWEEASQVLLAQVTVGATSRKDAMGYAFEPLVSPVKLTQGKLYRLTTQEFANGGDPWYKKENLPDEEYDASYIKILRDCYASGSTSFPSSQNLSGAAYGVPTFLVEGENPLEKIPRFIAPFGTTSIRFSTQRKSLGTMISHSGASALVLDAAADQWRTFCLQSAAYSGVHSVDFVVKCAKPGGVASGHVCIGADWSPAGEFGYKSGFLGTTATSFGWMPSVGSLWVMGKRVPYGTRKQVTTGDILTITVDYDHELVSFSHNGVGMGVAIGASEFQARYSLPTGALPSQMLFGASLNGTLDVVHARPAGIAGSTLRLHWLLDLHNSVASLAGRVCSTLIAGNPVDGTEEELLPWLQSPLLSGGVALQSSGYSGRDELPDWSVAMSEEDSRWNNAVPDAKPNAAPVRPVKQIERMMREEGFPKLAKKSSFFDDLGLTESIFLEDLVKDMGDSGASAVIISWLEKASPDRSFLSRLGKFPMCERPMCAALIKHSPIHVLHEVQAIISSSKTHEGSYSVDHIDLAPSDDLILIWKRIVMMRHWLIKTRQEYRARSANDDNAVGGSDSTSTEESSHSPSELEMKITVAKSFDDLVVQIHERASFLCILNPPAEERERMRLDSQLALSNLAEKWSAQKTPPSLEPMLERWKSLRESDSSKWSGIVDVLRAQHRWRKRRASVNLTAVPVPDKTPHPLEPLREDDDDDVGATSKNLKYRDSFSAMLRACDLYIRNGVGAPPEILRTLLDRRQRRSECRVFGLEAMKSLLTVLTMDSIRHNALLFLRPAFRGFTEDEKESRDLNDGQVVAETFRATVRHHYLKGLEGCSRRTVQRVQRSFWNLYSLLANMVAPGGSGDTIDSTLKQAIVCAWCLDFESRDHSYILKSGFLSTLQNEFSMGAILQRTHHEIEKLKVLQQVALAGNAAITNAVDDLNWHPLSDEFVQRSALSSGLVTKRDIMLLVLRAPRYACSPTWWRDIVLLPDESSTTASPGTSATRHTVSSMSLRYSELLANLQAKLSWCQEHALGRKVLQFGASSLSSTASDQGGAASLQSKADQVSYAEVPALGEATAFTMEMWIYPTELGGYRVLRADNGFHASSVYVELVDRHIQVAINGNRPREQLFNSVHLESHAWAHVAVVYQSAKKSVELLVNGRPIETKVFTHVGNAVVFRESRIGCWMSDAGDASTIGVGPQRVFKGSIAEIRLWKAPRTRTQICRDYQRAIPCEMELSGRPSGGSKSSSLLGLWHLDEGEGVCGNNRVEPTGAQPSQRIMETAGCNASLIACHWARANVPVWSSPTIDHLSGASWQRVVSRLQAFQRRARRTLVRKSEAAVQFARGINQRDERALMHEWMDDEDALVGDEDERVGDAERWSTSDDALMKILAVSTDDTLLHQKHVKRCAWIVFRFLSHTAICGTQERTDSEATTVAAVAKSRRKQRVQSDGSVTEVSSPAASLARGKSATFEEEDVTKTAELASDAAKTAVTNRKLEEPMAQTLWFSNEVYRKVFEIVEKELGYATVMIQHAEGLTRAQRMVRSTSTPVKDREIAIRPQQSVLVHGSSKRAGAMSTAAGFPGRSAAFSTSRSDGVVLEPLEVELYVFNVLTFVLSQSASQVATTHLARPRVLRELLQLLRLGSPRSQRIVKLILRRVCASGVVGPKDVAEIWGSESVLVDLLLDQVAESVCSTAAPMPTIGLSVSAAPAGETASWSAVAPITESLANPVGFRSGQVYLSAASESVALLRLLMTDRRWGPVVAELLSVAVNNVAPILTRRPPVRGSSVAEGETRVQPPASSDIRIRTAIIRAVGALCVLGSHTDCIRIGGKIEVTAKETEGRSGKAMIDYGFNFSSDATASSHRPTLATLIELNTRSSTARVVFDGSDESNPSHNVQEVSLATVSPVEEVHLPGDSAPPLSAEMIPVILKLASLDESEVISSFDDLWRMQIRSRALLAFESILRHSSSIAGTLFASESGSTCARIPPSLLEAALSPVSLSTFVSVPFLQERGRMILCRLIEASTPFGEPMFRGLSDPKPFATDEAEIVDGKDGGLVESSDDPVEEETEEVRVRRGFASTLAAMGFEFDLCMAALENSRNDPNLAVEWLMGPGAIEYLARQDARRLATATIASRRAASSTTKREERSGGDGETSWEAKAEELQTISGMPYRLAYCALELSNDDPNRAMEWLMEHGSRYADKPESLVLLEDALRIETSLSLSDAAALEGIDQPDALVSTSSHETSIDVSAGGLAATTTPSSQESASDTTNIMAVTLAPILAPLPVKHSTPKRRTSNSKDRGSPDTGSSGFAALDPDYLTPYVLLTVSDEIGPVQRLSTTGRTGVFRAWHAKDGVLITFLNTETGAYEDEWHAPKDVRRITKIYDEALDGVSSIHRVALRTEKALSTHYARRGVTALLRAWEESHASSATVAPSDGMLTAVGGPRQFVNLLKLIAASEMVFSRKLASAVEGSTKNHTCVSSVASGGRATREEPVSILHDLKVLALKILREEAQRVSPDHSTAATSLHGEPSVGGGSVPGSPRLRIVNENVVGTSDQREPTGVLLGDGVDVDDGDLYQAIALSMQGAAGGAVCSAEESKADDHEELSFMQRLYASHPRSRRTRQPSYTEAQEVASAYLGGSVDDHDGLLSGVLVKECVSHFVESTRVAGQGGKSTGGAVKSDDPTMEFQSLHPYYGRCEYTRAVAFDKSHRCLRVKFDQRCKLGPKAKLTFYADPSCETVLTTIDAAATTPGPAGRSSTTSSHTLSDVMIPSHQFWFKFSASEEDLTKNYGYGFRFQVKPVQSISWANESEVQTNASLEWACWVLEFLLNQAADLVARGAVHNRKIYGALVRYLRSPSAPFKSRVVRLLIQLLHQPDKFPVDEIPDLDPLEGIGRLAIGQAKHEKGAGKVFLSAQLLQLVELSIVTRRAADTFKHVRASAAPHPQSVITSASLVLPTPLERKELADTLNDLVAMSSFLLGETNDLPPYVLMAIWLDVFGSVAIIETEHPYSSSSRLDGTVEFPGAQALIATFDSRCATAAGVELQLRTAPDAASGSTDRNPWTFGGGGDSWPSAPVDLPAGSSLSYSFPAGENPDARFGVSVCIAAVGVPPEQRLARASVDKLNELLDTLRQQRSAETNSPSSWTTSMDCQLMDWVNNLVENSGAGPSGLASNAASGSSIASVDIKPSEIRLDRTRDALRCTQLLETSQTQLQLRFSLLKHFNQCIKQALPLLDLRDTVSPWSVAHTLRQLGHCVFFDIKNALVEAAIDATNMPGGDTNTSASTARITLDRLQALESRDDREVEPSVSQCFFAQAFRQLHQVDPILFRRKIDNKGRLFSVKFRGEEGVDWGGVYREGVNSMVDDLFSAHFNLFVLCPNGQHDTGTNRAMYLPNPKCTSPVAIQMFEFVGKLLGISLRTHGDFPFAFPSLVWKQLIGQPLDVSDLDGSDAMFVQMLDGIRNCERDGIFTEDEFEAAFDGLDLRFTAFDCNGHEVALVENGKTTRVSFENRLQYCRLAETYRLQESGPQLAAMARGLATVFPLRVLTLLTWHEMEMLTCGSPKIDIALWKQHTRYDGYNEHDDTVTLFWAAMASFSDEQRSDFVRFAWGRSRLPRGKWPQPFKLTKKGGRDSTLSLPVAHTCFFSVELPPYTTLDKMTTMLLATINFGLGGILMA